MLSIFVYVSGYVTLGYTFIWEMQDENVRTLLTVHQIWGQELAYVSISLAQK